MVVTHCTLTRFCHHGAAAQVGRIQECREARSEETTGSTIPRRRRPSRIASVGRSRESDNLNALPIFPPLEPQLSLESGRRLLPGVTLAAEAVAVIEEGLHVGSVEIFLLVPEREVPIDVGEVEVEPVALGRHVDPIEIAEALRVDE